MEPVLGRFDGSEDPGTNHSPQGVEQSSVQEVDERGPGEDRGFFFSCPTCRHSIIPTFRGAEAGAAALFPHGDGRHVEGGLNGGDGGMGLVLGHDTGNGGNRAAQREEADV